MALVVLGPASALRCYVCGGHSGTPCRGGMGDTGALEEGALDTEGTAGDPVQECTDLINNRGCVKQFVNGGKSGIMRCCPCLFFKRDDRYNVTRGIIN